MWVGSSLLLSSHPPKTNQGKESQAHQGPKKLIRTGGRFLHLYQSFHPLVSFTHTTTPAWHIDKTRPIFRNSALFSSSTIPPKIYHNFHFSLCSLLLIIGDYPLFFTYLFISSLWTRRQRINQDQIRRNSDRIPSFSPTGLSLI